MNGEGTQSQGQEEVVDGAWADVQRFALALVVANIGMWTAEADTHLCAYMKDKGMGDSEERIRRVKEVAYRQFHAGRAHLFLCAGEPCRRRMKFDHGPDAVNGYAREAGVDLTTTACQGPCKQAPVATLRVGQACEMFAEFARPREWAAVLDYAGRARSAETLLVDPGSALPYRFDPSHDHEKSSAALDPARYLLGHFEGEVHLAHEDRSIRKEVIGSWEAGGRFLALRIGVTYQRANGRSDRHQALVLIGPDWEREGLIAHAYSDSAAMHEFPVVLQGRALSFPDRIPHGIAAVSARKVCRPSEDGFIEELEFDRGLGLFETYYTMSLRRRSAVA